LTTGKRRKGGRNHHGRICVFSKGGGHKQRYRLIDFKRAGETTCVVQRLEYDPNRSAWIALIKDEKTAELSYIIAPRGIDAGDIVCSGENVQVKVHVESIKCQLLKWLLLSLETRCPSRTSPSARSSTTLNSTPGRVASSSVLLA